MSGKSGGEKGDGKKSERGGVSNMGGKKLAGKGKFSWRDMFFGRKREWLQGNLESELLAINLQY